MTLAARILRVDKTIYQHKVHNIISNTSQDSVKAVLFLCQKCHFNSKPLNSSIQTFFILGYQLIQKEIKIHSSTIRRVHRYTPIVQVAQNKKQEFVTIAQNSVQRLPQCTVLRCTGAYQNYTDKRTEF